MLPGVPGRSGGKQKKQDRGILHLPCGAALRSVHGQRPGKGRPGAVLMLLAARAPESTEIKALCKQYGAMDGSRFAPIEGEKCIMCGLCARACASLGTGASLPSCAELPRRYPRLTTNQAARASAAQVCAKICPTRSH